MRTLPGVDAESESAVGAGVADAADASPDGTEMVPPTLHVVSPTDGSHVRGLVPIVLAFGASSDPGAISLNVDGTTAVVDSPYVWDTGPLADGPHLITVVATIGGYVASSATISVIVDNTPPTVSTVPSPNATDVVLRAPIVLTFSEPILPSTLGASTVVLTAGPGGTIVPTTISLNADGTVATIAVAGPPSFMLPSTLTLSLGPGITDLVGNALGPTSVSWTVPDFIKWPPLTSFISIQHPVLAITRGFQPMVGYIDLVQSGSGGTVNGSTHVQRGDALAWTDLGGPAPNGGEEDPFSLVLDRNDNPTVAWAHQPIGMEQDIYVSSWTGSAWNTLVPVDEVAATGTPATDPVVRMDPTTGNPVAAWLEQLATSPTQHDVFVARWTGTQWDKSPGQVGVTASDATDLAIDLDVDPMGTLFVNWRGASLIAVATWDGSVWTQSDYQAGTAANSSFIALDPSSAPLDVTTKTAFKVSKLVDGTWQQTIPITVPAGDNAQNPKLVVDPNGNPVVGWIDTEQVGFARWTGNAWDARAGLVSLNNEVFDFSLSVDSRGTVWVAFVDDETLSVWMSNY